MSSSPANSKPAISVIVPLYNSERFIVQALESLLAQSLPSWEAIIVNDGSTDEGPQIARAYAARDERFRIVDQSNRGLSAARNAGIAQAQGQWVHFLDADDWMWPHGLERMREAGESSRDGLVGAAVSWHVESGESLAWSFGPCKVGAGHEELTRSNRFQVHGTLVRRDVLADQCFDESLRCVEDWDLWLRLTTRGARFTTCRGDADVGAYRLRPSSMSRDWFLMARTALHMLRTHAIRNGPAATSSVEDAVRQLALGHAAATCTGGSHSVARARQLLDVLHPQGTITSAEAAQAAWWMIPFAMCLAPNVWTNKQQRDSLLPALSVFGALLRTTPQCGFVSLEALCQEIAVLALNPDEVASAIAARCRGESRVILYGLGRNAGSVAAALGAAGISFEATDDSLPNGEDHIELAGMSVPVVPRSVPLDPSALYIITPTADASILKRLPDGARIVRWSRTSVQAALPVARELRSACASPLEAAA